MPKKKPGYDSPDSSTDNYEFEECSEQESGNEYEEYYPNTYDPYQDEEYAWYEL